MDRLISILFFILTLLSTALLTACGQSNANFAPVRNAWVQPPKSRAVHVVRPKDTLYAIAWRYDMDYRQLARLNHLKPPYQLTVGQEIKYRGTVRPARRQVVRPTKTKKITKPVRKTSKVVSNKYRRYPQGPVKRWQWPVKGRIIKKFSPKAGAKGIDIAGTAGTAVKASAAGRVAYSGSGIRAYGNLLIIKHNDDYMSAYAHNSQLLVKEGQSVKAGQIVARMGRTGTKTVKLHFEIRKTGKPVDPLRYLRHG